MKRLFAVVILIFSGSVFGAEVNLAPAPKPPVSTAGSAEEMLRSPVVKAPADAKKRFKFSPNCTDASGRTFAPGSVGYDSCAQGAQQTAPGQPAPNQNANRFTIE